MSENELYNEGDCRVTNSQIFSGATSYAISSVTRVVLKRNLGFVPFIFIGLGGLVVIAGFDMAIVAFGLVMIAIGGFIYTKKKPSYRVTAHFNDNRYALLLLTRDEDQAERLNKALNQAIASKG